MTFDQKVNDWRSRRLPKNRRSNGTLEAEIIRLTARVESLEYHLRSIAEGNLGDEPWAANYDRIRKFARAALSTPTEEPKT